MQALRDIVATTTVDEVDANSSPSQIGLKIFVNAVQTSLEIGLENQMSPCSVEIYSVLGECMHRGNDCRIDISMFPNGWYAVNFAVQLRLSSVLLHLPLTRVVMFMLVASQRAVLDNIRVLIPTERSELHSLVAERADASDDSGYI